MRKSTVAFLAALLVISASVQDGNAATKKPIPKKFTAKIPITLPVAQSGPITFANVVENFQDIPEQAWQNVQAAVNSNTAPNVPINIVIGPNTKTTNAQIVSLIKREYALFYGFAEPPTYTGLVFSATDYAWALAKLPKMFSGLAGGKEMLPAAMQALPDSCAFTEKVATECYGGSSIGEYLKKDGFSLYGVDNSDSWTEANQNQGPMIQVTHMLSANIQASQFVGVRLKPGQRTLGDQVREGMPCWFIPGQGKALGVTVFSTDLPTYLNLRLQSIARAVNPGTKVSLTSFNVATLTKYLKKDPSTCNDTSLLQDYQLGFSVGHAAVEALIAIGGPQATMALVARKADGDSWQQAFQNVYGISWNTGALILGRVLAAEYGLSPMEKS